MKKVSVFLASSALAFLAATTMAHAQFTEVNGDGQCEAGQRVAEVWEVKQDLKTACAAIGQWDIVRLANGASLSGPGYKCGIIEKDTRTLGQALCVKAPELSVAVGTFDWKVNGRGNSVTTLNADGTCSNSGSKMNCVWKVTDMGKRAFTLNWDNGKFVDSLTLSADGKVLEGKNQHNHAIQGTRK